jgi:hypothetical protein
MSVNAIEVRDQKKSKGKSNSRRSIKERLFGLSIRVECQLYII